jgi:hypothetical protein
LEGKIVERKEEMALLDPFQEELNGIISNRSSEVVISFLEMVVLMGENPESLLARRTFCKFEPGVSLCFG